MNIASLKIKDLFGLYDYAIDFGQKDSKFTVLTSPNGYGKTTILRMIHCLSVKRLFFLYQLKFQEFLVIFDDGSKLLVSEPVSDAIETKEGDTQTDSRRGLSFIWTVEGKEKCRFDYKPEMIQEAKQNLIGNVRLSRRYGTDFGEFPTDFYIDGEGGEVLNTELARMQKQEQFLLQLATIQTDFIGANRIYRENRRDSVPRMREVLPILQVVRELREMLSNYVGEFQSNFQRLDTKLIDLLLEGAGTEISEGEYEERSSRLKTLIDELNSYGLTNKQSLPAYRKDRSMMLDVYLQQMEEKLAYYKELLPLIRMFDLNVRQKKFANKTIALSPQHGLRVVSDNGDILRADMLSTGEQNQLVLLYDLIFKTPKGSILLIDEPESSLHVAWQNDFVEDMQDIASIKNLQIVVATHSAIIVSNTPVEKVFDLFYMQNSQEA